jgi:prepilin-type N-terminal cleavage/methylation domain-containing protein
MYTSQNKKLRKLSQNNKGFTLVELMVVVVIIAILALVGFSAYARSQQLARDTKRKEDMKDLTNALALYQQAKGVLVSGTFKSTDSNWSSVLGGDSEFTNYTNQMPQDPISSRAYEYIGDTNGFTYTLCTQLESPTSADTSSKPSACTSPYIGGLTYNSGVDTSAQTAPTSSPIIIITPTPTPTTLTNGLVSYWNMDQPSGNLIDSVSSYTGVVTGTTSINPGKINRGRSFNGSPDYVTITHNSNLNPGTGDFSLSYWMYYTGQRGGVAKSTGDPTCFSCSGYTGWDLIVNSDKIIWATVGTSQSKFRNINAPITPNQWTLLTMTWQASTGILKLYVNGALSGTDSTGSGTVGNINFSTNMVIGCLATPYCSGSNLLKGQIDEVGIWNRALTGPTTNCTDQPGSEVCKLYNSGNGRQVAMGNSSSEVAGASTHQSPLSQFIELIQSILKK